MTDASGIGPPGEPGPVGSGRMNGLLPAETASADETHALGRQIAARLAPGDVLALHGGLGAGKTHLAQGIAAGLGAASAVTSPTFTLVHEHSLPGGGLLLHLDLYRIETPADAARLGLGEMLAGDAVALVEWPDNAFGWLPPDTLHLRLTPLAGDHRRVETLDARLTPPVDGGRGELTPRTAG